jgi:hypothetical protein
MLQNGTENGKICKFRVQLPTKQTNFPSFCIHISKKRFSLQWKIYLILLNDKTNKTNQNVNDKIT